MMSFSLHEKMRKGKVKIIFTAFHIPNSEGGRGIFISNDIIHLNSYQVFSIEPQIKCRFFLYFCVFFMTKEMKEGTLLKPRKHKGFMGDIIRGYNFFDFSFLLPPAPMH